MTRLTATNKQRQALEKRKAEDRAFVVRGRAEVLRGAGQLPKMDNVDNRIRLMHLKIAHALMDEVDAALDRFVTEQTSGDALKAANDQDALLAERGVETERLGTVRTRDGWRHLKSKGKLTAQQTNAGDILADLFRIAASDSMMVCANDNEGGRGGQSPDGRLKVMQRLVQTRLDASEVLYVVREHIVAATASAHLYALLEAVCGCGRTVRSIAEADDRRAGAYEAELKIALDMACVAMKAGGKKEMAA